MGTKAGKYNSKRKTQTEVTLEQDAWIQLIVQMNNSFVLIILVGLGELFPLKQTKKVGVWKLCQTLLHSEH